MNDFFPKRLRQRRRELDLTQEDLAFRLNIGQYTISAWETGKAMPEADNLIALSRELSVSIDWLLGVSEIQQVGETDLEAEAKRLLELLRAHPDVFQAIAVLTKPYRE